MMNLLVAEIRVNDQALAGREQIAGWSQFVHPVSLAPPGLPSPLTEGSKNSRLIAR
jgi:hypothetical protein